MDYDLETYATKDDRLEAQAGRLTGSTIPTLLGYGYQTPLQLWARLTGKAAPEERPERVQRMLSVRSLLEPEVIHWAEQAMGEIEALRGLEIQYPAGSLEFAEPGDWFPELVVIDREQGYLAATPDGLLLTSEMEIVGSVEAKTDGRRRPPPERREQPGEYVVIQVHVALAITGWEISYIPTMWGVGDDFTAHVVQRDPRLCDLIRNRAGEFWWFVQRDEPPPAKWIDGSKETRQLIGQLHPEVIEGEVVVANDLWEAAVSAAAAKETAREATERYESFDNALRLRMGAAEFAEIHGPDGAVRKWRRRAVSRKGYVVEPKTYIDFREIAK